MGGLNSRYRTTMVAGDPRGQSPETPALLVVETARAVVGMVLSMAVWTIAGPRAIGELVTLLSLSGLFGVYACAGLERALPLLSGDELNTASRGCVGSAVCLGIVAAVVSWVGAALCGNGSFTHVDLDWQFVLVGAAAFASVAGSGLVSVADQHLVISGRLRAASVISAAPYLAIAIVQLLMLCVLGPSTLALLVGTLIGWVIAATFAAASFPRDCAVPLGPFRTLAIALAMRRFTVLRSSASAISQARIQIVYFLVGTSGTAWGNQAVASIRLFDLIASGLSRLVARSWGLLLVSADWRNSRGEPKARATIDDFSAFLRKAMPRLVVLVFVGALAINLAPLGKWEDLRIALPALTLAGATAVSLAWTDRLFDLQQRQFESLTAELVSASVVVLAASSASRIGDAGSFYWVLSLGLTGAYAWRSFRATLNVPAPRVGLTFLALRFAAVLAVTAVTATACATWLLGTGVGS